MQHPRLFLNIISIVILAWFLIFSVNVASASGSEFSWQFSSAADFTISDSTKVKFFDGSVKIIPTGAISDGYESFRDSVYNGANSTIWASGLVVDNEGNFYIAGNVNEDTTNPAKEYYSFIEKLDSNFNTVWNQKYAVTPATTAVKGGFDNIILSADKQFIYGLSLGLTKVAGVATAANVRTYKINASDGSVVWLKERIKTIYADRTPWADTWDEGNGPKLDSEGNIYISYFDGCTRNLGGTGVSGPMIIVKYDSNGNELWSKSDDFVESRPTCTRLYPTYEDSFEMVVDSENSVYIASSYRFTPNGWFKYTTLKYDKDGNLGWKDLRDYDDLGGGDWDSPRSLSIDSNDYIYVSGNPPTSSTKSCLLRKLDKSGNVIIDYQDLNPTGTKTDFDYCWGATIDKFDRWVSVSLNATGAIHTMAYYKQSGISALSLENLIQFQISGASGMEAAFRTVYDKYGNIYAVVAQYTDASGKSATILKSKNTYPDTMPATGTPVTLINNTGFAYENLSGFSVSYGEADQNDAGFQISNNGTNWYYWNGLSWVETTGNDYSSASTINSNIASFSSQLGSGTFYFKTFMLTDGTKQVDLASITISYSIASLPSPAIVPPQLPRKPMTVEELKQKIAEISEKIGRLKAQLQQLLTKEVSEIPADYRFTVHFKYGQESVDVRYLQIFLKAQGAEIYPEGIVSGWFGPLTEKAVIRFQEKYAPDILAPWGVTEGTGFVGKTTLAKINEILGR